MSIMLSIAQILNRKRGKAPIGKRWVSSSVYTPAGQYKNTRGTSTVPAKVAAQMNALHLAWAIRKGVPA